MPRMKNKAHDQWARATVSRNGLGFNDRMDAMTRHISRTTMHIRPRTVEVFKDRINGLTQYGISESAKPYVIVRKPAALPNNGMKFIFSRKLRIAAPV